MGDLTHIVPSEAITAPAEARGNEPMTRRRPVQIDSGWRHNASLNVTNYNYATNEITDVMLCPFCSSFCYYKWMRKGISKRITIRKAQYDLVGQCIRDSGANFSHGQTAQQHHTSSTCNLFGKRKQGAVSITTSNYSFLCSVNKTLLNSWESFYNFLQSVTFQTRQSNQL